MIPRVGEAVKSDIAYRLRPGAYAILVRDGSVLLTHQATPTSEFQLPGGGVDADEFTLPALRREIQEETGWRVGPLRHFGAFRRFTYMPEYDFWAEKVCQVYFGRPTFLLSAPTEPDHSAHWVAPADAVGMLGNDGDRLMLSRFLQAYR